MPLASKAGANSIYSIFDIYKHIGLSCHTTVSKTLVYMRYLADMATLARRNVGFPCSTCRLENSPCPLIALALAQALIG